MPLYVYNFEIKTIEEIMPSNMAASSVIFLIKISECLVVSDHCESTASHELIEPLSEGIQHTKSFQVIGKVSTLCQSELLQHKSSRTGALPFFALCKNSAHPGRESICHYPDMEFSLILLCSIRRNIPNDWFENRHLHAIVLISSKHF